MDIFLEYDKIAKHLQFSKTLHVLNEKGKGILKALDERKKIRKKRSGNYVFSTDLGFIYNIILDITNVRRFNKLRLFFCLQHYLDELLFKEVKVLESFCVEDEEYAISTIYFNQDKWYSIDQDDIQIYDFEEKYDINLSELTYLRLYFDEYDTFIADIKGHLASLNNIDYIKSKLSRIFTRIINKIVLVIDHMNVISKKKNENFNQNST